MPVGALNHFTIHCVDLDATHDFYTAVFGLTDGERPPLGFPGAWLCSAGQPTVHLVAPREGDAGEPPRRAQPTGQLDHIAFREMLVPRDGQTQLFFHDPNGVAVELNYPPEARGT
jgi:catechol 2,3-dioxygenase-like lactoylglutathione lyase family enzyme